MANSGSRQPLFPILIEQLNRSSLMRRGDAIELAIEFLIEESHAGLDGALILPELALVEPGWLVYEIHEYWRGELSGTQELSHSFNNLSSWLKKDRIPSLQHRLKGRSPMSREEVKALLRVMLSRWSIVSDGTRSFSETFQPKFANTQGGPVEWADRICDALFGEIFGEPTGRDEIFLVPSPGVNAAHFMRADVRNAAALLLPIRGDPMQSGTLHDTIYGTAITTLHALAQPKASNRVGPILIWMMRRSGSGGDREQSRYLVRRSQISTLFSLMKVFAEQSPRRETFLYPDRRNLINEPVLPKWSAMAKQLVVILTPQTDPFADTISPPDTPAEWETGSSSEKTSLENFGFCVTDPRGSNEKGSGPAYWRFSKPTRDSDLWPAFSRMTRPVCQAMREGHKLIFCAAMSALKREKEGIVLGNEVGLPKDWQIVKADSFIRGEDLNTEYWS